LSGIAVSISNSFEVSHIREKERKNEEQEGNSQRKGKGEVSKSVDKATVEQLHQTCEPIFFSKPASSDI